MRSSVARTILRRWHDAPESRIPNTFVSLLALFCGDARHVDIHSLTVRAKFNLRPYVKYGFQCTDYLRYSQALDGIMCNAISIEFHPNWSINLKNTSKN